MLSCSSTGGHGKGRLQHLAFVFPALTEDMSEHRTSILNARILLESQKLHHHLFAFQKQHFSTDTSNTAVSKHLLVKWNNSYFILGKWNLTIQKLCICWTNKINVSFPCLCKTRCSSKLGRNMRLLQIVIISIKSTLFILIERLFLITKSF